MKIILGPPTRRAATLGKGWPCFEVFSFFPAHPGLALREILFFPVVRLLSPSRGECSFLFLTLEEFSSTLFVCPPVPSPGINQTRSRCTVAPSRSNKVCTSCLYCTFRVSRCPHPPTQHCSHHQAITRPGPAGILDCTWHRPTTASLPLRLFPCPFPFPFPATAAPFQPHTATSTK